MSSRAKEWLLRTVLLVLLVLTAASWNHFSTETLAEINERKNIGEHPPFSSLQRPIINVLLLGQKELYDDFIHLWTTQYLASKEIFKKDPKQLEQILRRIAHLKVRSPYFYQVSCFRFIFDFKTPWLCEEIAKIGMAVAPESWIIPAILGYAFMEQEDYHQAARFFTLAGKIEGSPDYFKEVGSSLLVKKGVPWEEVLQAMAEGEISDFVRSQLEEGYKRKQLSEESPVYTVEPPPAAETGEEK